MSTHRYIRPIDQPSGTFRLIDWMESNFKSDDYKSFKCLVAFAKIKPFYKLHESIQQWNSKGHSSEAIIGIDHKGTSYQALQYVLANFDTVDILHADYSTFHPKLYIFSGPTKASAYYGSSNFTSGGLETNFEGGVIIEFNFPDDQIEFDSLMTTYLSVSSPPLPCSTRLSIASLTEINARGLLLDESTKPKVSRTTASASSGNAVSPAPVFGGFITKPARSIPRKVMKDAAESAGIVMEPVKRTRRRGEAPPISAVTAPTTPVSVPIVLPVLPGGFVIQVIPHHNGEILLSKVAVGQNPQFFGFPFTGETVPKKAGNPTYPQRVPDPVVNINVYDKTGALVKSESQYQLNTIYYTKKSEIRITITPSILKDLNVASIKTNYPILVMSLSSEPECDYELDFYEFGSPVYDNYLAICDQTLPSGGKPVARKMGWI